MGHKKLKKFAENETFACLLQPSSQDILADGYFRLRDHAVKGQWNSRMFAKEQPIILELGCGKGEYTIDLAQRNPQYNYIGVDIKGARLWKGAKYATEHKLGNVAFLRTRIELISAFFAENEVSEIWLTFSDPQFKSENSRLTSPLFLERYRGFLKPGGIVHLKTDSMFLHKYSKSVVLQNGLKLLACTEDLYGTAPEELFTAMSDTAPAGLDSAYPAGTAPETSAVTEDSVRALYEVQTFYEKMFLDQGCKITYLSFVIDHEDEYIYPVFDSEYWRSVEGPRLLFGHDSAETRRQKIKTNA